MIDEKKKASEAAEKEKVRRRYAERIAPDILYPAKKQVDFYDDQAHLRVAVYVRVSTDHIEQVTSYELQKNYYEEFVTKHPNWVLVKIYADEGISGTSTVHRKELNQMMADCHEGKIDLIITKSVSRLARNVVDCITMVRNLSELPNPVGVFFESECIFSLNQESQMPLSFLATIAEEESHIRSRSMEVSLSQRLNGGLPLTPKLLGYTHDANGHLVINPEEAPTVKLIFYMYLYGFSSAQIAEALEKLERKTYRGNIKWTAGTVIQVLRNERHCGDVLTRKTWTPNYRDHKSIKNRGARAQGLYQDEHEPIISRDDYIAVQHMIDNAKYGNKSILPELRVIEAGLLKGFVIISPKWAGFKAIDYMQASMSVYDDEESYFSSSTESNFTFEVEAGDFDMRGFEVLSASFFSATKRPNVLIQNKRIRFSTSCVQLFSKVSEVEILIHPGTKKMAVRKATNGGRQKVRWAAPNDGVYHPKEIQCAAFGDTLFDLLDWDVNHKHRAFGTYIESNGEAIVLFNLAETEIFVKPSAIEGAEQLQQAKGDITPIVTSGKRIQVIPQKLANRFGSDFYFHQLNPLLDKQNEEEWKLRLQGRLYETSEKLHVTSFEELREYIYKELSQDISAEGDNKCV